MVLGALHAHALWQPIAYPSQKLIARETDLTRQHVNRCCMALWRLGLICWAKARFRGSRGSGWDHNVYRLRNWEAPLRARILELLRRLRWRSAGRCDSNRTASSDDGEKRGRAPRSGRCYDRIGRSFGGWFDRAVALGEIELRDDLEIAGVCDGGAQMAPTAARRAAQGPSGNSIRSESCVVPSSSYSFSIT
jgi:hypothetical protein